MNGKNGFAKPDGPEAPAGGRRRKALRRRVAVALFVAYCALYGWRFVTVNRTCGREYMMASELPEECRSGVELLGAAPEEVGVWKVLQDIDGDGETEWLVDAGDHARGAANSWWKIWKPLPGGAFADLGEFYCDAHWELPPPWIFGHPVILCVESRGFSEWVPWRAGRYSGHDDIGMRASTW